MYLEKEQRSTSGFLSEVHHNKRGTISTRPSGSLEPMPPLNCFRPQLNSSYKRVTGQEKYPTLRVSGRDTGERFGLEYIEPGCRPVPLDWDKHRTQKRGESSAPFLLPVHSSIPAQDPTPASTSNLGSAPSVSPLLSAGDLLKDVQEFLATPDLSCAPPVPLRAYPSGARVGPIKTGGRVFVLDHTRWTPPMKEAIDDLLQKHRGDKEMLKLVDQEYAAIVHRAAAADPNSLLHPTTRLHISRYVKHLVKLLNTSSSLNISPEKLRDTQPLWHSLTDGSESSHVPVVTVEPATFNPPAPALSSPLTQHSLEKIPKSRYETDGSSIHFFYQQGPVRYFYCSQKVHQSYAAEGLSNPKMSFEDFSTTDFFQRELDATKTRMVKEMSWKEFSKSPFYEAEKQRWVEEKNK
nr:uncharacterized protein LOC107373520 [Nothobranchius furzeri]